ncbi:GNAT family N-acetyltransferase [Ornithinimicrobium faecis]|uniref:GNAT family N-acetyltransferase n=1 Tax=Ornithinimicrobium faecis TaxID=2934158 RepID=A0ABY4YTW6_9MICO|nr:MULTISPECIES: GNAT family N-acetyltransferase [unclassified Ornithinimicrobium]USQ80183.1 GNAT family N-acetyltransferase [Ornithinimicrobium sp. HY1793]
MNEPAQISTPPEVTLRAIRSSEWRQARDLRLRALQDEDAGIAFFATHDEAVARTDDQWRRIAEEAAIDAGPRPTVRQFVAIDPAGHWVGTVTVRLAQRGSPDFGGGLVAADQGMLLAVWIDPLLRGRGLLTDLIDLAASWVTEQDAHTLGLWVHEDNARARRAYAAAGFEPTGRRVVDRIGPEIELSRQL